MHVIWVTGLALPCVLGLIVFFEHQVAGFSTVDFTRSLELIAPLTPVVALPFAILAAITRHIALKITAAERNDWITWNFVASGALVGLIITLSNFVIEPILYSGPGAWGMMMAFWIFTLPLFLFWSVLGVIAGGVIGLILAVIRTLFEPS